MSRRPGLMKNPLLIPKPEINASLEDWYNYFFKAKTREMTLQLESVKNYMMHYYGFLQKDQIDGRCYDFLSIPNVMGEINKSKFSKMLKEKKASRKRKLDIKITKTTGPNELKIKKINPMIFVDSEEDSDHSPGGNIKILKATETKKTSPLIFNDVDSFEDVFSARANIANKRNEPKKRKASPTIFEDPKTFNEDSNSANIEIATDNEPKKRKTSPPIFKKSDFFEDSLSSRNDYDTGMASLEINDETEAVQEKRFEIEGDYWSDDSLELRAHHLEGPFEDFKSSIIPIGRKFKPSKSDSSVFEESNNAKLNGKQVRFKEKVDFQSQPVAGSDSDEDNEPSGFFEAMTKKEELEKVEREIGQIRLTKLKLDGSESEYSEIQMGFLRCKNITSPTHSEPSMEIQQDSPIDMSVKKQLLIQRNYHLDGNKYLISQEISYTENVRGGSPSQYFLMKFLKNENDEPILKDDDPTKLILSITNEMNMAENLGEEMRKLKIVSSPFYKMHSAADFEETMDLETSHIDDPSTFKKIQTSENSQSVKEPSTDNDCIDQSQTSSDEELTTTNDNTYDSESDKNSSFSSQPSMISSTVILPGFKFL